MVRDYSGIVKALMGEWDKTSQPLKERASILPLGQYEDGSVGLAWPGILAAPAEGMVNFGRYGYDTPEAIRDNAASAFDVAGGAVTGGLGVGLAGGLADDAVKAALPMNEAARLARARGLGFDTDNVWYHGSPHTFDEFEIGPNRVGTGGGDPYQPMSELGAFFTQDPEIAALYGPNVRQFYVRGEYPELYNPVANKPEAVDTIDQTAADMRQLLSRGYDGAKLTGPGTEPELAVFNPKNIRSVNAAFDPSKSDSANLLAANAKTGAAVPIAVNALERASARPSVLASRDVQQIARSLGYDPQRVVAWAKSKVDELAGSRWAGDQAEAERFRQIIGEVEANPASLSAIRQSERASVEAGKAERERQKTSRQLAARDGFSIVRNDDPYVGGVDFNVISPDGSVIGGAQMSASRGVVENPEIGWVSIAPEHQRKGLASWLYDEIERDIGRPLWPSPELISPEIQAFWEKRAPDRLRRMRAGTYANAPTGSIAPLGFEASEDMDPALLEYLRLVGIQ